MLTIMAEDWNDRTKKPIRITLYGADAAKLLPGWKALVCVTDAVTGKKYVLQWSGDGFARYEERE